MPEGQYDHSPIIIVVYPDMETRRRPFKYFHMWSEALNFQDVVDVGWKMPRRGCFMYKVVQRLKQLKMGLKKLNHEGFSDIHCRDI